MQRRLPVALGLIVVIDGVLAVRSTTPDALTPFALAIAGAAVAQLITGMLIVARSHWALGGLACWLACTQLAMRYVLETAELSARFAVAAPPLLVLVVAAVSYLRPRDPCSPSARDLGGLLFIVGAGTLAGAVGLLTHGVRSFFDVLAALCGIAVGLLGLRAARTVWTRDDGERTQVFHYFIAAILSAAGLVPAAGDLRTIVALVGSTLIPIALMLAHHHPRDGAVAPRRAVAWGALFIIPGVLQAVVMSEQEMPTTLCGVAAVGLAICGLTRHTRAALHIARLSVVLALASLAVSGREGVPYHLVVMLVVGALVAERTYATTDGALPSVQVVRS